MGALELRNKLIGIINTSDERFLRMVNALHSSYQEENDSDVVAHSIKGTPITRAEYIQNNQDAVNSYKKGEFKTHSQMRQKYASK